MGSCTFQHAAEPCSPYCHFTDGGCQQAPRVFQGKGKAQINVSKVGLKIIHTLGFTLVLEQEQQKLILDQSHKSNFAYFASVFAILTMFSQYSNGESDPKSKQADPALAAKDQTGNKWQYLQQELSSRMKSPLCQLVEPQVRLSSIKHSFCRQLFVVKISSCIIVSCLFIR